MIKGLKVIDADAHMQEPIDLWDRYVEPAFYDRRPKIRLYENRLFFHYEPGELYGSEGRELSGRLRPAKVTAGEATKYGEAFEEWWSAESRLRDMDRYGWDKMVLIPGTGAAPIRLEGKDPQLIWALTRAYHNWCHDFASADPKRLKMVGNPPTADLETTVSESRRAVEDLGAITVMMPKPPKGKFWHDPEYNAFWDLAIELDFPVSFHGVSSGSPHTGTRYHGVPGALIALEHAIGFPFENMMALGHLIYTGILERYPNLRVSLLEGNAGWLPFWLGRLDDHAFGRQGVFFDAAPLSMKPSEYFKRQAWVACDGDEYGLPGVVSLVGDDNLVWNTDYPHPDAPHPAEALPDFLAQPIPEKSKKKILWDNPARLYGERILN